MNTLTNFPVGVPALIAATLLALAASPSGAAPEKDPAAERILISTGKTLAKGESAAGEAVMTIHPPAAGNGAAVLVFPGGGYGGLVTGPEGHGIATWLTQHGIVGVVVEYRLPKGNSSIPLGDARRATRIVRLRAADWGCDPKRIGNMGFSAGGHLASTAATHFDQGDPKADDPIDRIGCRPDFSILIYPVITMGELGHGGSRTNLLGPSPDGKNIVLFSNEKQVTANTPPTFLAHAEDDNMVPAANSAMYYEALVKNKVPAEYLKLPTGGHGLNGYQGPMWEAWKTGCLEWLAKQKFIRPEDVSR